MTLHRLQSRILLLDYAIWRPCDDLQAWALKEQQSIATVSWFESRRNVKSTYTDLAGYPQLALYGVLGVGRVVGMEVWRRNSKVPCCATFCD